MKRLSIFNSEADPRTGGTVIQFHPKILTLTFATILVLLASTELILRMPAVQRQLPIRTHLHEPGVVVRLQTLNVLKKQFPRVDVLFVGSSIVRCNIRPLLFDTVLARGGHADVVSFNVGMSGLWPSAVRLYLEELWLREAHPRLVIQGIRFGELLPSPRARKYDAIVEGPVESAWQDPGPLGRLKATAFERVHLLQYRGVWPAWLARYRDGRSAPPEDDELRVFTDPRGWTPRLPTLDVILAKHLLDNEEPNTAVTDARAYQEALEEIRRSARAARRAGARYALVNVPEHAFRWSAAGGREGYRRYLATMENLADTEGFAFIDVTDGDPTRFSAAAEYSDYHPMSPDGAARFTTLLATEFGTRLAVLLKDARPTAVATATTSDVASAFPRRRSAVASDPRPQTSLE